MTFRVAIDQQTGRAYPIPEGGSEEGEQPTADAPQAEEPNVTAPATAQDDGRLPEDHPLVVTMRKERESRKQAEAELAELRKQQMTESERAVVEAKEQGAAEARIQYEAELGELRRSQLAAKLQIHAAKVMYDPADAVAHIDLSDLDPSDGNADAEIARRLDALIESKPYLRVSETRPSGSNDAVSRPATSNGNHVSVGAALKAMRGL